MIVPRLCCGIVVPQNLTIADEQRKVFDQINLIEGLENNYKDYIDSVCTIRGLGDLYIIFLN